MTYSDIQALILSNLPTGSNITAANHRAVENALLNFAESQWLTGDIKEIDCTDAYIAANFTNTGLGILGSEREGWAICNGQNGTRNRTGRVSVGYGATPSGSAPAFPSIGTGSPIVGGSKDSEVISHSHYTTIQSSEVIGNATSLYDGTTTNRAELGLASRAYNQAADAFDYELVTVTGAINAGKTSTTGVAGTDKNMQPYIVTLFIQKL
jgi:hypothetical protein